LENLGFRAKYQILHMFGGAYNATIPMEAIPKAE